MPASTCNVYVTAALISNNLFKGSKKSHSAVVKDVIQISMITKLITSMQGYTKTCSKLKKII